MFGAALWQMQIKVPFAKSSSPVNLEKIISSRKSSTIKQLHIITT